MRAREYMVLDRAVEEGVARGWLRAHKHTDSPPADELIVQIEQAVMTEICQWFDFDDGETLGVRSTPDLYEEPDPYGEDS